MNRYGVPLVLTIVAAAIFVFYVDGGYRSVQHSLEREKTIQGYIEDANNAQTKLDELGGEYQKFPENADDRLNLLLPDDIDPVAMIVNINDIALIHGLQITGADVTSEHPGKDSDQKIIKHTLKFKVLATYSIFREFLKDLEASLALRDFHSFKLQAGANPDGQEIATKESDIDLSVIEYTVELTGYSLR